MTLSTSLTIIAVLCASAVLNPLTSAQAADVDGLCLVQNKVSLSSTAGYLRATAKADSATKAANETANAANSDNGDNSGDAANNAAAVAQSMEVLDEDEDGVVTKPEVEHFAESQNLPSDQMDQEFAELDKNHDDKLTEDEIQATVEEV